MAESKLNETFQQIKNLIIEMPLMKKLSILVTLGVATAALIVLLQLSNQSNYQVLFTNLEPEDSTAITTALEKYNISYQMDSATKSVMVPGSEVLQTRLKLARDGLPQFSGVGFEIFDSKSFGMTDFEQRLNFQRALQGELQRTINEFKEIEDTRVHLVLPEKNVFLQSKEMATASVILKVEKGEKINEETVRSIVHLVSASVANLEPGSVTVVDTSGNLLTVDMAEDKSGGMAGFRKKRDLEYSYEQKVKQLLEPIIGFGKVKVQVTADLDFTSKETTEEKFDPESIATRTESRSRNKETDKQGTAGDAGSKDRDTQNETVSYEVSKQIQKINHPIGEIKNLSIAVIVDGLYTKNDDGTSTYAPRKPEDMKNFEDIIKSAIGFNDKRGDQLKVMNLAFQNPEEIFAQSERTIFDSMSSYTFYINILVNVVIGLVALLIIFFVIKPVIAAWGTRRSADEAALLAAASNQMLSPAQVKDQLEKKAVTDPADMVNVLRRWLE